MRKRAKHVNKEELRNNCLEKKIHVTMLYMCLNVCAQVPPVTFELVSLQPLLAVEGKI